MNNIRFIRINGRIVPMRSTGIFSERKVGGSEAKKIVEQAKKISGLLSGK